MRLIPLFCLLLLLVLSISIPNILCDIDSNFSADELDSAEEALHDYYDSLETLAEVEIDSAISLDPAFEIAQHSNIDSQVLDQSKYETKLSDDETQQIERQEAVYNQEANPGSFRSQTQTPVAVKNEAEVDAALDADEEELTFKRRGGRGGGMGMGNGSATNTNLPAAARQALQQHSSPGDCWCVLNGQIYDLSKFRHSGGQGKIRCGGDITGGLHRKHGNRYDNFFDSNKIDMTQFGSATANTNTNAGTRKLPGGLTPQEVEEALKLGLTELAKEKKAKAAHQAPPTDQAADAAGDADPADPVSAPMPVAPAAPVEIPPGPLPSATDALAMDALDADLSSAVAETDSVVVENQDEPEEDPSNTYGHQEIVREHETTKSSSTTKPIEQSAEEPAHNSKSIIHSLPFQLGVGGGGALVLFIGLFFLFKRCNLYSRKPAPIEGGLYLGNNDKTSALITHVL